MAEKKCPDCPKCLPGWLVQFGDLMSLLLCFFILLLSMATMDKKKVEEYIAVMQRSMGFLEGADDTAAASKQSLSKYHDNGQDGDGPSSYDSGTETTQDVQDIVQEFNNTNQDEYQDIQMSVKSNNEFTLDIPSALMFEAGQYNIDNPKSKQFIAKLARVIRTMPQDFNIEVMGYAASNIKSDTIPRDSWDISALRSIAVVKELIKNKIDPATLKVSAFGSYRPKSDTASENRRVELRFVAAKNQSKMINQANFFDRIGE